MFLPTKSFGLANERKALALLIMGCFATLFGLLGLLLGLQGEIAWGRCFGTLGFCYGIGFFALAANWFWGRWFAIGFGYSGVSMAVWSMISIRAIISPLVVYGVSHALVVLLLQGEKMIEQFDNKPAWRKRFQLDDDGVERIRKTVTRAASSLPGLILFALSPRQEAGYLVLIALAGLGIYGVLRARFWGLIALLSSASLSLWAALHARHAGFEQIHAFSQSPSAGTLPWMPMCIASIFLLASVLPFAKPAWRFFRK